MRRRQQQQQQLAVVTVSAVVFFASITSWAGAIDYPGGWDPRSHHTRCVDICAGAPSHGRPGDYAFLVLEQLFVPQYCRDLLRGVDATLAHRGVAPFPLGLRCHDDHHVPSELTIHGLWPNYHDEDNDQDDRIDADANFPVCCRRATTTNASTNAPLPPRALAAPRHRHLLKRLGRAWRDPTQAPQTDDTLCELYNHEFQKHGLCFVPEARANDLEHAAVEYFEAGLRVAAMIEGATRQINAWARGASAPVVSVDALAALFPRRVQILCATDDTGEGGNRLGAIRSCYDKPSDDGQHFAPRDCPVATSSAIFRPCAREFPVSLESYSPPVTLA